MKKDIPCKHFENIAWMAILVSDKVDIITRNTTPGIKWDIT